MIRIESFAFNAFQENMYILINTDTKECIIFDPGCSNVNENKRLLTFIEKENLIPVRLINTHCHIDHVLGNHLVAETYGLELEAHKGEVPVLQSCVQVSSMYGIAYTPSPAISKFIEHGDIIHLGEIAIEARLAPGHSPASLCFVDHISKQVIGGDVLFHGSIGRTDLPGGSYRTLIESITTQLMTLADDYKVYSGHGPTTTIGHERATNPFLNS
jgi:hydroxyacylglutathione hydrolase